MSLAFTNKFGFAIGSKKFTLRYRTSKLLDKLFAEYNRKYFKKQLCLETITGFVEKFPDAPRKVERLGCTYVFPEKSSRADGIFIHWKTTDIGGITEMNLLHEMVHLYLKKTNDNHGPLFDAQMRRLVKAGAYKAIL